MKTSFIAELANTLACIESIRPAMKREYGLFWPYYLMKVFSFADSLFKKSRWTQQQTPEAAYAKTIMIFPAFYAGLKKKYKNPGKALDVAKEIIRSIIFTADNTTARQNSLEEIEKPFERWLKYRSTLIMEGFGRFNAIEDVYISRHRMHYVVRRCIFHDVFSEAGMPELTPIICDYDFEFHSAMFKELYFDRNGSTQNTIGHGSELCHYVWKDKKILSEEFRTYVSSPEKQQSDGDRRGTPRRQADRRQGERRSFDRRTMERRKD